MNSTVLLTLLERESERVQKLETVCAQLLAAQAVRSQGVEATRPDPNQDLKPDPMAGRPADAPANSGSTTGETEAEPTGPRISDCQCTRCTLDRLTAELPESVRGRVELHASLSRTYRFLARFKDPKVLTQLGFNPGYGELSESENSTIIDIKHQLEEAGESIQKALGAMSAFESLQSA